MKHDATNQTLPGPETYFVGDNDRRPWGSWRVTRTGRMAQDKEFCEKLIVVNPGKILSLQSHELRCETWTVLHGTLIAIVDAHCLALHPGQSVHIPVRAVHTMANPGDEPCLVQERQEGICRESDITRYLDSYGRSTVHGDDERIRSCVSRYHWIAGLVERKENCHA